MDNLSIYFRGGGHHLRGGDGQHVKGGTESLLEEGTNSVYKRFDSM